MPVKYKFVKAKEVKSGMVRGTDSLSQRHHLFGKSITEKSFANIWTHRPGCRLPREGWKWHDEEEVEYIVQGKMVLSIGDAKGNLVGSQLLEKGDFFFIGKGVRHAAEVIGKTMCIGIVFCPKAYDLVRGQPSWSDHTIKSK